MRLCSADEYPGALPIAALNEHKIAETQTDLRKPHPGIVVVFSLTR
jgi:hypothetical protein